jgi:hypothetical protein
MPLDGGTAVVNVVANGAALSASMQGAVKSGTKSLASPLASAGKILGVTLGAAFVVGFGKKSLEAVQEADKVNALLARSLGQIGDVSSLNPIIDWADKLQFVIGQDDEAIKTMATRLVTMGAAFFDAAGPDAAQALENLTLGLTNMATATGKSTQMLMRSLGPAILNTPEKAIPLLQKYGTITEEQAAKVQALVDAQDKQAATQLIINTLTGKYAGAAAAAATPAEKMAVAIDEMQESFGRLLLPIVEAGAGIAKWAANNIKLVGAITGVIAATLIWTKLLKGSFLVQAIAGVVSYATALASLAVTEGITATASLALGDAMAFLTASILPALAALAPFAIAMAGVAFVIALATGNVGNFGDAIVEDLIPKVASAVEVMRLMASSGDDWATAVKVINGETGKLTVHLNKNGEQVKNFGGVVGDAMKEFKTSVVESVQVTIGQFKKVGDAFTLSTTQLRNQANAAVKIARTQQRDLRAIFSDKSLTEVQQRALAQLPADQRHAFAEGGKAIRAQIAQDATRIQALNDRTFNQITRSATTKAKTGGEQAGRALGDGLAAGIAAGTGPAVAAANSLGNNVIQALRDSMEIASPSKAAERIGNQFIEGLVKGLTSEFKSVERALDSLVPLMAKAIGTGAADQAKAFLKELEGLDRRFEKLKTKIGSFRSAIRGAFADASDLIGTIGAALEQFRSDQEQFLTDQAAFTGAEGQVAPVAPNAPDIQALVAAQVAQAQQLAKLLKQLQDKGLSTANLADLAGQGAGAIPIAEALLADPALIQSLNDAQQAIADITQRTADQMTNAAFGDKVERMSEALDKLLGKLREFLQGLDVPALKDETREFIDQLRRLNEALAGVGGGGGGGGVGGGNNITVNVNVGSGADGANVGKDIRDALLQLQRRNGTTGL